MTTEPAFTIGVEEEYLLVDKGSLALASAPDGLMEACAKELEGQVSPEFLACQIEVGTKVCADIGEAREDLRRLRAAVARHAGAHNLAPIAASCHPFADWARQNRTDKDRYHGLARDMGSVAERLLICGMHVHVGIGEGAEGDALRVDLMPQLSYFLPHMLALSCSSPFWQGRDTGLASYRLSVFDNLPRTGLPPQLSSWVEYERTTGVLVDLGLIEDTSKIWWDLRPSHAYPTLETRICDVSPRLEDALAIAALNQALTRMLWRLRVKNQRWRAYDRFLVAENRWRAQRYGLEEGLIDFGRGVIEPMDVLVDEIIELVEEDAGVLRSVEEIVHLRRIVGGGGAAAMQRRVYAAARETGEDHDAAMRAVVAHLVDAFHDGL